MWGPLKKNLQDSVMQQVAREHRRDLSALPFAMTFQVMIFLAPMLLVIRNWTGFGVCALIAGVAFLGLQRIWLRHIHTPAPSLADCRREFPSNSA